MENVSGASGVRGAQMLTTNRFDPSVPDSAPLKDRYDVRSGMDPDNSTTSSGAALTVGWHPNDDWSFKSVTAWRKSDTETSIDFDTLQEARPLGLVFTKPGRNEAVEARFYSIKSFPEHFALWQMNGLIGDLIVGIVGAFIGNYLFVYFHWHLGTGPIVSAIIQATVGAVILLFLLRLVGGFGGGGYSRRW